jgi:hypothetical protein
MAVEAYAYNSTIDAAIGKGIGGCDGAIIDRERDVADHQ